MAHHETVFPINISYGSRGGPRFFTQIVELDSGAENRIGRWSAPRHVYDVSYGVKSLDDLSTLKTFFIARLGALHSFKYKDWNDFTSAANGVNTPDDEDVQIGVGDVGGTTTFQLVKKYTDGGITRTRNITKPVSGTVVVALDGAATTAFTVDTTTGIVTMNTAPGNGVVVTAGFEFYVPVRFEESTDEWMQIEYESYENGNAPNISLIEVFDEVEVAEEFNYGGTVEDLLTADRLMTVSEGRAWIMNPQSSGYKLKLPDPTNLEPGGPYFFIQNANGSNTIDITESDGTAILTLGTSSALEVILSKASDGTKAWHCF